MTLVDNFCQLYLASMKDAKTAARLSPRLSEIWNDMSVDDRKIACGLLEIKPTSGEANEADA